MHRLGNIVKHFLSLAGPSSLDLHPVEAAIRAGMSLTEVENLLIRQTLTRVTANREGAPKVLGVSRRTLQYKLREFGLLNDSESKEAK